MGLLALFSVGALSLIALAYLGWNPVGAAHIQGIQGRYFLPLLPLLLTALPSRSPPPPWLGAGFAVYVGTVLAISAWRVVEQYYLL